MKRKKPLFDISGKTALITGAAGLLGLAHARALLAINANVLLTDINYLNLIEAKRLLSAEFLEEKIKIFVMDVTSESSIEGVAKNLVDEGFRVDILINNAAINPTVPSLLNGKQTSRLEFFPIERWNTEIAVGLTGSYLCSKIFGTGMAADGEGGVILNIASDLSIIAPDQNLYKQDGVLDSEQTVKPVCYSVIKTGLIGLTRYIACYWADKGIRSNALSPGGIYVDQDDIFVSRIKKLIPMGRMANKDEYAGAIQFLCSDASSYMNGQNMVIDGGRSVW